MLSVRARALALATACAGLAGCQDASPTLTGVRVIAVVATAGVDQLAVSVTSNTGKTIVVPTLLPTVAAGPIAGERDLVVYLNDAMAGHSIRCHATGLMAGTPVDDGAQVVTVALHEIVDARVVLTAVHAPPVDCGREPAGTVCAPAACDGSEKLRLPKVCDGQGECKDQGTVDCKPYACNPTINACGSACSDDGQCCCGTKCKSNRCTNGS